MFSGPPKNPTPILHVACDLAIPHDCRIHAIISFSLDDERFESCNVLKIYIFIGSKEICLPTKTCSIREIESKAPSMRLRITESGQGKRKCWSDGMEQ